jgi:hypothetical protein
VSLAAAAAERTFELKSQELRDLISMADANMEKLKLDAEAQKEKQVISPLSITPKTPWGGHARESVLDSKLDTLNPKP